MMMADQLGLSIIGWRLYDSYIEKMNRMDRQLEYISINWWLIYLHLSSCILISWVNTFICNNSSQQ